MLYCTLFNLTGRSRLLLNSGRRKNEIPTWLSACFVTNAFCFLSLNDAGKGEGMLFRHTCLRMAMRSFKEMYVVAWIAAKWQTCNSCALWLLGLISISESMIDYGYRCIILGILIFTAFFFFILSLQFLCCSLNIVPCDTNAVGFWPCSHPSLPHNGMKGNTGHRGAVLGCIHFQVVEGLTCRYSLSSCQTECRAVLWQHPHPARCVKDGLNSWKGRKVGCFW